MNESNQKINRIFLRLIFWLLLRIMDTIRLERI